MIQLWKHKRNGSPCRRPHLFLSRKLKSAFLSSWFMSGFKLIIRHLSIGKYLYCKIRSAQTQQPAKAFWIMKIQLQWQHRHYFKHHLLLSNRCQLWESEINSTTISCWTPKDEFLGPKRPAITFTGTAGGHLSTRFQGQNTESSLLGAQAGSRACTNMTIHTEVQSWKA